MTDIVKAFVALQAGIAAARGLELDVSRAEFVEKEAVERLGILPDAFVLVLVGGTGSGKSTLLNALAGETVSPAGARGPTTQRPVAWVSTAVADGFRPLLERLDVESIRTHQRAGLERVMVLELPDVDSLDAAHRSILEAILPRLDAVAWVTDPQRYADAIQHDAFLRTWIGRLDHQVVILNKTDRLGPVAVRTIAADLTAALVRELPAVRRRPPPVIRAAAIDGEAGIAELRRWLAEAIAAKAVVSDRIVEGARAALADLAGAAGVSAEGAPPLVTEASRQRAIIGAVDEVLRVVDLAGAQRQAVAATRAQARWRGTGPIGLITSIAYRLSGRARRSADPAGYLQAWRDRGSLLAAAEIVRKSIDDALPAVPAALRPGVTAVTDPGGLERRLETALDQVVARGHDLKAPASRLWPILGLLQTANTALLVLAAAWVVVWVAVRPPVPTFDLPLLDRSVPAPVLLLVLAIAIGYVLARVLSLHAGWLGRRWAREVSDEVSDAIRAEVTSDAFVAIDSLEVARAKLGGAWRSVNDGSSSGPAAGPSVAPDAAPITASIAPPTAN